MCVVTGTIYRVLPLSTTSLQSNPKRTIKLASVKRPVYNVSDSDYNGEETYKRAPPVLLSLQIYFPSFESRLIASSQASSVIAERYFCTKAILKWRLRPKSYIDKAHQGVHGMLYKARQTQHDHSTVSMHTTTREPSTAVVPVCPVNICTYE